MDKFRRECFRNGLRSVLEHRFLSRDFPHESEPMKRAIVLDAIDEIISMVEMNFDSRESSDDTNHH